MYLAGFEMGRLSRVKYDDAWRDSNLTNAHWVLQTSITLDGASARSDGFQSLSSLHGSDHWIAGTGPICPPAW
jgi:hypothetical protein